MNVLSFPSCCIRGHSLVAVHLKSDLCRFAASVTFDVSVYNHVAVQVGDSLEDLSAVSSRHLLCQGPIGF